MNNPDQHSIRSLAARVSAGKTLPYGDLAAALPAALARLEALAAEWRTGWLHHLGCLGGGDCQTCREYYHGDMFAAQLRAALDAPLAGEVV